MTVLAVIFLFSIIILVHESGHYWAARLVGVHVISFNFGFGPILFSVTRNQTLYALRALPFGGSVQLAGLDEITPSKVAKNKKYPDKNIWQRFFILGAGSSMNIFLGYLIIVILHLMKNYSLLTAVTRSFLKTGQFLVFFLKSLSAIFSPNFFEYVAGPIGIFSVSAQAAQQGIAPYLGMMTLLTLNIGLLNLLPFPALDGGRIVFLFFEAVFRKKPSENVEKYVHLIGFMILLALILYISVQDVSRLLR